jgi:hypothetical protein
MSKRPPSRSTRKKDAAVQFLKSLESKDSKALKYVDLDKYIQHTCMPRTACLSFAKTAHGVFAVTCLRRCVGGAVRVLGLNPPRQGLIGITGSAPTR